MPDNLIADIAECQRDRYGVYVSWCMNSIRNALSKELHQGDVVEAICQDLMSTLERLAVTKEVSTCSSAYT